MQAQEMHSIPGKNICHASPRFLTACGNQAAISTDTALHTISSETIKVQVIGTINALTHYLLMQYEVNAYVTYAASAYILRWLHVYCQEDSQRVRH